MINIDDKVLFIAPHADDETLGCGGTIAKLREAGNSLLIYVVTGPGDVPHPLFKSEVWDEVRKEFKSAIKVLGSPKYKFGNLPAAILDTLPIYKINKNIESIISNFKPNIIFMPSQKDLHKDHLLINYATRVAARPYLESNKFINGIFEYETLSETDIYTNSNNSMFLPNLYIDISDTFHKKIAAFSNYKSQKQNINQPRSEQSLTCLAKYRGKNIGVEYAEGFEMIYYVI